MHTKNVEKERLGSTEKEMTLPIQQREWLVLGMENTSVMCDISVFAHIAVYFVCKLLSVPVPNTMFVRSRQVTCTSGNLYSKVN